MGDVALKEATALTNGVKDKRFPGPLRTPLSSDQCLQLFGLNTLFDICPLPSEYPPSTLLTDQLHRIPRKDKSATVDSLRA